MGWIKGCAFHPLRDSQWRWNATCFQRAICLTVRDGAEGRRWTELQREEKEGRGSKVREREGVSSFSPESFSLCIM